MAPEHGLEGHVLLPLAGEAREIPDEYNLKGHLLTSPCVGSGDIGQDLLSSCISIQPVVIELVRGLVAQGLMGSHSLVRAVTGQQPV